MLNKFRSYGHRQLWKPHKIRCSNDTADYKEHGGLILFRKVIFQYSQYKKSAIIAI